MGNKSNNQGLGVAKLALFSIGLTLASGVFSLSGDFAAGRAHTLAVLLGWVICGVGMLGLTMCFFKLSVVKTDLTSGIYSYAKEGFGEFVGFNSAWGYWMECNAGTAFFYHPAICSIGKFLRCFRLWQQLSFYGCRIDYHLVVISAGIAGCKPSGSHQCGRCYSKMCSHCRNGGCHHFGRRV